MKRVKVLSILLLFLNFCLRWVGHDWSENPFLLLESVLLSLPSCDSSTAFFLSFPCLWDAISCPWIWHRLPKTPVQTPLILLRDSPPHQMTVFAALVSVPSKCPHHKATTLNCKWLIISAKLKLSGLSQPGDFITLHSLQGGPARSKSRSIIGQEGTGLAHNWVCSQPEQRTSLPGDAALQRPKENVNT